LFSVAARFDVFRVGKKKNWSVAKVVDLDFVGHTKRVKFHFPHTDIKHDIWVEAESDKIAPLYTHTNKPLPRQRKNVSKDELRSKTTKQSKLESFSDDASSDSSFAVAAVENGNAVVDDENGYEEIGVVAVKENEEIGDADTEESEVEELDLVDSDEEEEEEEPTDDDAVDDGLDDEIDDDESEESCPESEEKKIEEDKNLAIATVTDHSSPDGSPKRERDFHSEDTNVDAETSPVLPMTPKKNSLLPESDVPAGSQSRIPKKKKKTSLGEGPRTILGALGPRSKVNDECPLSSSHPKSPAVRSPAFHSLVPSGCSLSRQKSPFAKDVDHDTNVNRDLFSDSYEHRKRNDAATAHASASRRADDFRKREIDRRNELQLNRDAVKKRHVLNEGHCTRKDSSLYVRGADLDVRRQHAGSDFRGPRRMAFSNEHLDQVVAGGFERSRDPYDYEERDIGMQSRFDSHETEDYRRRRLEYDRPNDIGTFEPFAYNDRHDDRFIDREARGMGSIPRNRAGWHDYASSDVDRRFSRREDAEFHPHNTLSDDERYYRNEDCRYEYSRHPIDHRPNPVEDASTEQFEKHAHCPRGRAEKDSRSKTRRRYDVEATAAGMRGSPLEVEKASSTRRGYPSDKMTSHDQRGLPAGEMESLSQDSSRRDGRGDGRFLEDHQGYHEDDQGYHEDDQGYHDSKGHREEDLYYTSAKYDERAYPQSDDGYRNQWDDDRHRDEYSRRRGSDDRRSEDDRRRDHHRYESSPRSRRRDHRGRDEYAYRAQEHARKRDQYYSDGYYR
jgi:hypothetical protein